mmetsp:Transcript_31405/g.79122  ORF Transcript_31405/g.79122 Transcript_31405/m.79122 type:complete len:247 (-) Transcript_31405:558-1298(-)
MFAYQAEATPMVCTAGCSAANTRRCRTAPCSPWLLALTPENSEAMKLAKLLVSSLSASSVPASFVPLLLVAPDSSRMFPAEEWTMTAPAPAVLSVDGFSMARGKARATAMHITPSSKRPAPATVSASGASPCRTVWAVKLTVMPTEVNMVEAAAAGHSCAPALKVKEPRANVTIRPAMVAAVIHHGMPSKLRSGVSCTTPVAGMRRSMSPSRSATQVVRTTGFEPCDFRAAMKVLPAAVPETSARP